MLKDVRNEPQKYPLSHFKSLTSRACDFLFFLKYCFKEQDDFFLNCIHSSNGGFKGYVHKLHISDNYFTNLHCFIL